jgi:putative salt-induced outer membrane protein
MSRTRHRANPYFPGVQGMKFSRIFVLAAIVMLASPSFAQDEEGFSGRAALGYLSTTGNTETESLNINFEMGWNYDAWHHRFLGLAVYSSTSNVRTAEAYGLNWETAYDINENAYWYGLVAWNKDKFSAYDQQIREAVGYGRRFINSERHELSGEVGVGARQADLRDGTKQDEAILRLSGEYIWRISETSRFNQTLAVEDGSDNTYLEATSSLSADIMESLALVVSYTIRSNSDVLPGTEKTDTFTSVSIEYSF